MAVWRLLDKPARLQAFANVESALRTLEDLCPRSMAQLRGDVSCILVAGDQTFGGKYVAEPKLVVLYDDHVLESEPGELACTLVHEAQHGRLIRLGFGYEEDVRARIERICYRAQRNFALKLTGRNDLVEHAEAWMEADGEANYSRAAKRAEMAAALRELGMPAVLVRLLERIGNRRAT